MVELFEFGKMRLEKGEALRQAGINPFAYRFERTHGSQQVLDEFSGIAAGEHGQKEVCVAGRLLTLRDKGKTAFAHIGDQQGKLQIYFKLDILGDEAFKTLV